MRFHEFLRKLSLEVSYEKTRLEQVGLSLAVRVWIDPTVVFGVKFLDPELPLLTVVEAPVYRMAQFVEQDIAQRFARNRVFLPYQIADVHLIPSAVKQSSHRIAVFP